MCRRLDGELIYGFMFIAPASSKPRLEASLADAAAKGGPDRAMLRRGTTDAGCALWGGRCGAPATLDLGRAPHLMLVLLFSISRLLSSVWAAIGPLTWRGRQPCSASGSSFRSSRASRWSGGHAASGAERAALRGRQALRRRSILDAVAAADRRSRLHGAVLRAALRADAHRNQRQRGAPLAARAGPECSNISPSIPMAAGSSGRAAVFALGVGGVLPRRSRRGAKRMLERLEERSEREASPLPAAADLALADSRRSSCCGAGAGGRLPHSLRALRSASRVGHHPAGAAAALASVRPTAFDGRVKLRSLRATGCALPHRAAARSPWKSKVPITASPTSGRPRSAGFLDELGDPFARTAMDADGRAAINSGVYGVPETASSTAGTNRLCNVGPLDEAAIRDDIPPGHRACAVSPLTTPWREMVYRFLPR